MVTGEVIITGELMATMHTGRFIALWDQVQSCFIFLASDWDRKQVPRSIVGVDLHVHVRLCRRTSLLSAQYVATQCYKCIRLTTRFIDTIVTIQQERPEKAVEAKTRVLLKISEQKKKKEDQKEEEQTKEKKQQKS